MLAFKVREEPLQKVFTPPVTVKVGAVPVPVVPTPTAYHAAAVEIASGEHIPYKSSADFIA